MSPRVRRQVIAVAVFLVVVVLFVCTFRLAMVHGDSMLPTYHDGQLLLVNRVYGVNGPLQRGDVVLVRMNKDVLIKRIAFLPGDEIPQDVSRAFRRVQEFFDVIRPKEKPGTSGGVDSPFERPRDRLKVPPGFIVVLGDNLRVSEDSRSFGPVALSDVLGRVVGSQPQR